MKTPSAKSQSCTDALYDEGVLVQRGLNAASSYLSELGVNAFDQRKIDVLGSGDWNRMNGVIIRINERKEKEEANATFSFRPILNVKLAKLFTALRK